MIAAIILLIAGIAFYPLIKNNISPDDIQQAITSPRRVPLNVNAQILKYETISDVIRTKGLLMPDEEVDLSFETSGKITRIYFNEGASVKRGELLAKVNDEPLQAELKRLTAQLPLAKDRVARQRFLLDKDAVSQESYESVTTELEKLYADIELVKSRIAQTELRAPFDGIMGLRHVSEGAFASPTTVISRLTNVSPLKLEFSINEKQISHVRPGTELLFTVEESDEIYRATVYAVESSIDAATLSLKARALYANAERKLKPGQSANIEINLDEIKNAIVIPSLSSLAEMGIDIVYVYRNGKAEQVVVQKGIRTAASVQITHGLNAGDTLITTGVMQLRNGMNVRITNINP